MREIGGTDHVIRIVELTREAVKQVSARKRRSSLTRPSGVATCRIMATRDEMVLAVQQSLSDELRHPRYHNDPNPLRGHCYVASEAVWHLLGGTTSGLVAAVLRTTDETHWFLRGADGDLVDPTAGQFAQPPDYARGRACGFLTRAPSRRAAVVIARAQTRLARAATGG